VRQHGHGSGDRAIAPGGCGHLKGKIKLASTGSAVLWIGQRAQRSDDEGVSA
jgi:hypothetical protein